MKTEKRIYVFKLRNHIELNPEKKMPDSEVNLYKTTASDACDYTKDTTTWD